MLCRGDGRRNARHGDGQRHQSLYSFFFFLNLFIFGCTGSSLLRTGFLWWRAGLLFLAVCGLLVSVASLAAELTL